ncbi:MAG: hypothetical protein JOZ69_07775 [Myxococcales bacterium]|nr:hypothetical protein [Myxococcales bacterium]
MTPVVVDRSTDLPIGWVGGGNGDVSFVLLQTIGEVRTGILCSTPASAGRGLIPAGALQYMSPTTIQSGAPASIGILPSSRKELTVEGWHLTVGANAQQPVEVELTLQ